MKCVIKFSSIRCEVITVHYFGFIYLFVIIIIFSFFLWICKNFNCKNLGWIQKEKCWNFKTEKERDKLNKFSGSTTKAPICIQKITTPMILLKWARNSRSLLKNVIQMFCIHLNGLTQCYQLWESPRQAQLASPWPLHGNICHRRQDRIPLKPEYVASRRRSHEFYGAGRFIIIPSASHRPWLYCQGKLKHHLVNASFSSRILSGLVGV